MIWIEVLGRHGVAHRVRCDRLPATIGRGYDNDVILDDELADVAHARVSVRDDGALQLEDLGSVNGTWQGRGNAPLRGAAAGIAAGEVFRIGRTRLRLAASDQPLPPARPEPASSGRMTRAITSRGALVALPLLGVALVLFQGWLDDTTNDGASLASLAVGIIFVFAAWAGGWALAGRLAIHQARFAAHHAVAWAFAIGFAVLSVVISWLDFFTESDALATAGVVASAVLFAGLVERHLALASMLPPRRRAMIAAAATVLLVGLGELLDKAGSEFAGNEIAIDASLKPVTPRLMRAVTVDQLLAGNDDLRREIDELKDE